MADGSNTARKQPEGKPFEKGAGKDPRINYAEKQNKIELLRSAILTINPAAFG